MKALHERYTEANIPYSYHDTIDLGTNRDLLKSFLTFSQIEGETFLDLVGRNNMGACVNLISQSPRSDDPSRKLVYALAKTCILHGRKTIVYDLYDFINAFTYPGEDGYNLYQFNQSVSVNFIDCLFITRFWDSAHQRPFSGNLMFQLENFFAKCLDSNVSLFVQSSLYKKTENPFNWWTESFLNSFERKSRNFIVGL
jgi:hypothetical protein